MVEHESRDEGPFEGEERHVLDPGLHAAFGPEPQSAQGNSVLQELRERLQLPLPPGDQESSAGDPAWPGFGRYRVDTEIGSGGLGVILRGRDPDLGRICGGWRPRWRCWRSSSSSSGSTRGSCRAGARAQGRSRPERPDRYQR